MEVILRDTNLDVSHVHVSHRHVSHRRVSHRRFPHRRFPHRRTLRVPRDDRGNRSGRPNRIHPRRPGRKEVP